MSAAPAAFALETPVQVHRTALFDRERTCRWRLGRVWDRRLPLACVIGNNPSAAGAATDDPTVHRWNHFFRLWGFGGYVAVNKYPWISSDPADCWRRVGPVLAEGHQNTLLHVVNRDHVEQAARFSSQVFVCWGKPRNSDDEMFQEWLIEELPPCDLWCFGKNLDGSPKHPMARGLHRVPDDQQPVLWRAA